MENHNISDTKKTAEEKEMKEHQALIDAIKIIQDIAIGHWVSPYHKQISQQWLDKYITYY